ncbi:retrovirus-related pol polyprotein from transposon TNT 1-94, partial [Tanacetum coccineum]
MASSTPKARLENKVTIVTGGARGIGECIVRLFVKHGVKVVIANVKDDLGELIYSCWNHHNLSQQTFGASSGNLGSPIGKRVDTMHATTDPINTTNTTNVSQSIVDENLPKILDSRGGSHVTNVLAFDKEDFTSWKVRFLVFLGRLETYLLKTLNDGPFVPMSSLSISENPLPKHQNQWSNAESQMWKDLILAHEGPSDIRDTKIAALRLKSNAFKSLEAEEDSNLNVEEDQRANNEFMVDLNVEYHERALLENQKRFYKRTVPHIKLPHHHYKGKYKGLKAELAILTKRIDDMTKGNSEKGKKDKEKSEKEDEPSVGKADARSGQWVDITMKKVHKLLSMTDGDERKHVLDYTHVGLHYVEDQRKNLVSKFNLLKHEVIRINLKNESLKDEIIDLKKVIEKWTCSKRKEKISSKEVVFTKADESSSMLAHEITSDSESECETQEPLPPLPKLIGASPFGNSESLISLSDLTLNMAEITLDTPDPKKTRPSVKVLPTYVIKKKTEKSTTGPKPCSDKKADSSTKQLLLTMMEEVKGLKRQIDNPSGTPTSSTQPSNSKASKQKTWFGPYKQCGFRKHLSDDCYSKPKCSTCGSTDHLTKEHLEHAAVKKTLSKLKAQSPLKPSPKKTLVIPKPFIECKYYGFNDHHSDH